MSGFHLTVEEQLLHPAASCWLCACVRVDVHWQLLLSSPTTPANTSVNRAASKFLLRAMQTCQKYKYAGSETTVSQRRVCWLSAEAANHKARYQTLGRPTPRIHDLATSAPDCARCARVSRGETTQRCFARRGNTL